MNPGHHAQHPGAPRSNTARRSLGLTSGGDPDLAWGPNGGSKRGCAEEFVIVCRHVTGVRAAPLGPVELRCRGPGWLCGNLGIGTLRGTSARDSGVSSGPGCGAGGSPTTASPD